MLNSTAAFGMTRTVRNIRYPVAFGGKPEKHTLVLSLTAFDPSGHSEAFTRLTTALVTDRAMEAWYHPSSDRRVTWQAASDDENS